MHARRFYQLAVSSWRFRCGGNQLSVFTQKISGTTQSAFARGDVENSQRGAPICKVAVTKCEKRTFRKSLQRTTHRQFCVDAGLAGALQPENWPEHEFVKVAETCLEHLSEIVSDYGYNSKSGPSDFDIEFSQGVLTINLGDEGTYVLNTQTPNRQIWLSSPSSGPWRFAWSSTRKEWISTRDGHTLASRMTDELSNIFKEPVVISFENINLDD